MTEKIPDNFHIVARERAELRKLKREAGPETADIIINELDAINEKAKEFAEFRAENSEEAKSKLKKEKEQYEKSSWLDEESISNELGESYNILSQSRSALNEVSDFEMQMLRTEKVMIQGGSEIFSKNCAVRA